MFNILLIFFIYPILDKPQIINSIKKDLSLLNKDIEDIISNNEYIFDPSIEHNSLLNSNNSENITHNFTTHGEIIFVKYYYLSFLELLCGFLIILYGAYYYMLGFIILSSLFIYYFIIIFIILCEDNIYDEKNNLAKYLYFFTFSIISGILLSIFFNSEESDKKKYRIVKFMYGCIFGLFLFKSIAYYFFYFDKDITELFFFLCFFLFIFIGGSINIFIPKFEFLPASVVSGSYFIIISISYILKLYYSDIFILKYKVQNNESDKEIKDLLDNYTLYTLLIMQVILIISSIIYQIIHYNNKLLENPLNSRKESYLFSSPDMSVSNQNNTNNTNYNKDEALLNEETKNDENEETKNDENEENDECINDQDE